MNWTAESRAFLAAVHEAGGRATMREIRNRTDLTEGQRQHQFRKLVAAGLIEIDRVDGFTMNGTRMKVAVLTKVATDEIQRGILTGSTDYSRRGSVDVAVLAEQIEEIQQYIADHIHPKFGEITELRRRVEAMER
jgi:DNA-binding Lrp family transcriptional regulator